jgi:hypothetical protein
MVAACLAALAGDRHHDAAATLRALAERVTSAAGLEAWSEAGQAHPRDPVLATLLVPGQRCD